MSTFPYVDISHKKIWRPLSTGRYVDPTLFLFIYFVAGSLPSWPNCGALCERGRSRGDSTGTWPRLRGVWQAGGCVCVLPSLPRSPLFSPLPVTIRRNVVAGSMTPWVEAASPLRAPGGCKQQARGAGGRPPELPAGGRAGVRRCPHAPLRCRETRVGRGGGGPWGPPGPAARRPRARARSPPKPTIAPRNGSWRFSSAPREVHLCWCCGSFVASPGLGIFAFANLPLSQPLCRRLEKERKVGNQ